jgi:OmpA-OmpF porin, OOP family
MVRCGKLAACSIALSFAHTAAADDGSRYDYISILPGYVHPSRLAGTTGRGFTFSTVFGHPFSDHFSLEGNLNGSVFEAGRNRGNDFYQQGIWADAVYNITTGRGHSFTPYIIGGVGVIRDDFVPDNRDGYGGIISLGAGFVSPPIYKGLMVRAEARYARDTKEGGISEPRAYVGLEIPLGRVEHVVETREVKSVEVREVVQAAPPPPPPPPQPFVDSDGDGVDDAHDRCPNTPHGVRVDANGCAVSNQVIVLKDVNFELGKSTLTSQARSILDGVAPSFAGQRAMRVEIGGHTDTSGRAAANLTLSQQRADAVREYLISRGVPADQLTAKGYGSTQLLADPEHSQLDRERNRRVELRVLSGG